MKRINLNNALKQLEELKRVQGDKDAVTQIVGEVTRLGKIRALFSYGQPNTGKQRERFFDTLSAMLNEPGINQNTVIIMDDMAVCIPRVVLYFIGGLYLDFLHIPAEKDG